MAFVTATSYDSAATRTGAVADGQDVPSELRADLRVVLSGTFHRDPDGLRSVHGTLAEQFQLLAPSGVNWVDGEAPFVRLPSEVDADATSIEAEHLAALRRADFMWLHCPNGYVGFSAAMEVGYANAIGIPVYSDSEPEEESIRGMVSVVPNPLSVPEHLVLRPGVGLAALQQYYERAASRRGWSDESARDTLLLLTEEVGELARAIRTSMGLARHASDGSAAIGEELADVQLYVVHLANVLGIDLANAVTVKERENERRHREGRADRAA